MGLTSTWKRWIVKSTPSSLKVDLDDMPSIYTLLICGMIGNPLVA